MHRLERCPNDNHNRSKVTVRCCPNCGGIVNAGIPIGRCLEQTHATARRARSTYCVSCGDRLARKVRCAATDGRAAGRCLTDA